MWISLKPMVDGFIKIFDEFRNGCDEKSATFTRHSPHRNPYEIPKIICICIAHLSSKNQKKNFANSISGKSTKNLKLLTLEFKFKFNSANAGDFLFSINFAFRPFLHLNQNK